jgi:hypothetical protein
MELDMLEDILDTAVVHSGMGTLAGIRIAVAGKDSLDFDSFAGTEVAVAGMNFVAADSFVDIEVVAVAAYSLSILGYLVVPVVQVQVAVAAACLVPEVSDL